MINVVPKINKNHNDIKIYRTKVLKVVVIDETNCPRVIKIY